MVVKRLWNTYSYASSCVFLLWKLMYVHLQEISSFLALRGYEKTATVFHTHVPQGRVGSHISIYRRKIEMNYPWRSVSRPQLMRSVLHSNSYAQTSYCRKERAVSLRLGKWNGKCHEAATGCLQTHKAAPEGSFSSSRAGWGCWSTLQH